ncbi:MAG: hypothetical protein KY476_00725 [Planctomycetes bacterium]|nr:hypothetical protein [Planctomycetota bacterium]
MPVSKVFVLGALSTPNNNYTELEDATPTPTAEVMHEMAVGHPQPLFTALRSIKPEVVARLLQVGTAFAEFGLLGKDHSAGNTDLFYRAAVDLGSMEAIATAAHVRLRMANAFCYLRSVKASHRQNASCELATVPTYDGVNEPIVPAGSQTLSITPAASEFYGLGPVKLNGTTLDGVQEFDVDFGVELIEAGDASDIWNTFIAIRMIKPVITIKGFNEEHWATYGIKGTALTSFTAYLRRKSSDGHNVADGGGTHASISLPAGAGGLIVVENSSGGISDPAQTSLKIYPRAQSGAAGVNVLTLSSGVNIV